MNFPKILIIIFASLIVIITCLIVGTTYGTRLAVNNRVKETTIERTCRTTSIKPYEPPSYIKENNIVEEIPITCTTKESKEPKVFTTKNRTAAPTSRITSTKRQTTSIVTTVPKTSTTEYTTTTESAVTTIEEEQDESSVLSFYGLRHF